MSWIKTIDRSEAEGRLKKVYDRISPDREAEIAEILKSHSLNPRVLEAHVELYKNIMFGQSNLSRSDREMVAVVVSKINYCHY